MKRMTSLNLLRLQRVCVRALIEHQLTTDAAAAAESMLAIRENKSRSLQDANKFTDQLLFE